jgi:nucleotide-binding universal stress UspA family protein
MSSATLHIVSAWDKTTVPPGDLATEFRNTGLSSGGEALLQTLSSMAKSRGTVPVLHSVYGDPVDAIIVTADRVGADLIVVGNKGMKGVRRLLGSIPNSVAHGANCSVAIIDTTE